MCKLHQIRVTNIVTEMVKTRTWMFEAKTLKTICIPKNTERKTNNG